MGSGCRCGLLDLAVVNNAAAGIRARYDACLCSFLTAFEVNAEPRTRRVFRGIRSGDRIVQLFTIEISYAVEKSQ